jgi:peptidoglycan/LPS O-acetylase OafA/YrhL
MTAAADAAPEQTAVEDRPASPARGRPIQFGFIPSLDGLRALAVLGVMLYHGGAPILGGGFLTIDVFFVLSGFLITSLLVGEWRKRLTIHLGQFWTRRARRLLPALLVMLIGVALYAKFLATPGEFSNLRLDSLSSLFYVANWHFIFAGTNYFNLTAQPSPLQHMWSLSIEEQFYIVWPPVVLLMLHLGNKLRPERKLWPLFATALVGAVASAVDMRLLYHGPQSVMRIYEGTDTRSQDLLVGATLAVGMAIWAQHRPSLPDDHVPCRVRSLRWSARIKPIAAWEITPRWIRLALQVLGWTVAAAYAYLWSHLTAPTAFLFRGGYFLIAVGVAIVIFCAVTNQAGSLARALGNRFFQYVGKISYGAYLWHFPLFAVLDAGRMHLYGYPLLLLRIGVTLLVATASFYLVEEPIRRGRMRSLTEWRAWLVTTGAFLAVVFVTVLATLPTAAEAATVVIPAPQGPQYAGPPVKVALFGDSTAFTAGWSISTNEAEVPYNVDFYSNGILGCGFMIVSDQIGHGVVTGPNGPCNAANPASQQWPAVWQADLARDQGTNVTMLMAGRWEVTDQVIDGRTMHIGQPAYDAILVRDLEQAVEIGTADGRYMILLTSPCFSSGEQPDGQPWPEDSTARVTIYDSLLRTVAAEHPADVEVDDFGAQVCPGGTFESTIDGIRIRLADGVHFPYETVDGQSPAPAARWLAWKLLPEAVRVGRLQMAGKPLSTAAPRYPAGATATTVAGTTG